MDSIADATKVPLTRPMPDNAHLDIFQFALLVSDFDEAFDYYTEILGFDPLEDTDSGSGKRWVRVAPARSSCSLLLTKAKNEDQPNT